MIHLHKSIVFTGIKHCGKTTVGGSIANFFSVPFFDIDIILEKIYLEENRKKLSAREIYKVGKSIFQEYENKAAEFITKKASKEIIVASAGGGFCDNPVAVNIMKKYFDFIYLQEEVDILYKRIIKKGLPAFLPKDKPYEAFRILYDKRSEKYKILSDVVINSSGINIEKLTKKTIDKITEEGYAGK